MLFSHYSALLQANGFISNLEILQADYIAKHASPRDLQVQRNYQFLLLTLLAGTRQGNTVVTLDDCLALVESIKIQSNIAELQESIPDFDIASLKQLPDLIKSTFATVYNQCGANEIYKLVWKQEPQNSTLHPLVIAQAPISVENPNSLQQVLWGFSRMWLAENTLIEKLQRFLQTPQQFPTTQTQKDLFNEALKSCTPTFTPHIRQWMAVCLAMVSSFCVISGGPGTGKTTLVRMLVLAMSRYRNIPITRMILCAPTGRAKARLQQGVKINQSSATAGEQYESINAIEAKTLHSLLGIGPQGESRFNAQNPLPYDLIVVDEASMVDVWMFATLLSAIAPSATLVLVGDMDQLPSVDAGAVLGDLTKELREASDTIAWPPAVKEQFSWLLQSPAIDSNELYAQFNLQSSPATASSPFAGKVSFLTQNQRSKNHPEILQWWNDYQHPQGNYSPVINAFTLPDLLYKTKLATWIESWKTLLRAEWETRLEQLSIAEICEIPSSELQKALTEFVVLCCTNEGAFGRNQINAQMRALCQDISCEPIIIERNTHLVECSVYNGDLGLRFSKNSIDYGAFIIENQVRTIELRRISHWSPAFAITVHKSQGSEFQSVCFVLPDTLEARVSTQLAYTAITRAKKQLLVNDPAGWIAKGFKTDTRRSRFSKALVG